MRNSRIFHAEKLFPGHSVVIDGDTAHYLSRVLRLKSGDVFSLFNPSDGEFSAVVTSISRNQLTAQVSEPIENHADPKLKINLGLGLSKGERMDFGIQKATELGVSSITGLITARSEVKLVRDRLDNKLRHWQKIANSACEQCGRNSPPTLYPPMRLFDWVEKYNPGVVLDHRGTTKFDQLEFESEINLLVGAEGGLSDEELDFAQQHQFSVVRMGPRVLRTETAPVVALSLVQFLYGDFRS